MTSKMAAHQTMSKRYALLLFALVLSLLAGFTAVSHESLWIDEANSALKAMQPSNANRTPCSQP